MAQCKLSYTANEIDERLGRVDEIDFLQKSISSISSSIIEEDVTDADIDALFIESE